MGSPKSAPPSPKRPRDEPGACADKTGATSGFSEEAISQLRKEYLGWEKCSRAGLVTIGLKTATTYLRGRLLAWPAAFGKDHSPLVGVNTQ